MKKILLVEDEDSIKEIYKETIQQQDGYQVDTAANGLEVLNKLKKNTYQLIFLDIVMPKISGIDILEKIKSDTNHKNTPIVILSNLDQPEVIKQTQQLGATDYIIKANILPSDLIHLIEKYI